MKTKIFVTLLSLGLSCSSIYAAQASEASLPAANDLTVTAPDQSGIWSFAATAVLMQPTNSTVNYATENNYTTDSNGFRLNSTTTPQAVIDNYYWWFGADIAYAFPGHGRDVTLSYEGLHGSTTDSTNNDFENTFTNPGTYHFLIGTVTKLPLTYIKTEVDTQYDAGDLVFGQKLNVGQRVQLHPFVGLRYARIEIEEQFEQTLEAFPNGGFFGGSGSGQTDSVFNGIGPRLGSDAGITLGRGFSLRGRLGLSALAGSQTYDADYSQTSTYKTIFTLPPAPHDYSKTLDGGSVTRIIPEIDARLGLNYSYHFSSKTALGFEAGWQWTEYFQVVSNETSSNTSIYDFNAASPHFEYANFGLQGPYARVQLDVA